MTQVARPEASSEMSHLELHDLERNEGIIKRGMRSFIEVGEALQDIRYRRLWRKSHDSFRDYLKDRWGMGAPYATRLISGSEVAKRIPAIQNEAQAREVARIPYTDQAKVVERASQIAQSVGRPLSAKDIRMASTEPSTITAREERDGEVVTMESQSEMWQQAEDMLADIKRTARLLTLNHEGVWLKPHIDTVEARIKDCQRILEGAKPHAPCPVCSGGIRKDCEACRDRGWLPKDRYDAIMRAKVEQDIADSLTSE